MADNTTICINGELRPGDLVLSAPTDNYACLVGTVLSIEKAGASEHQTGNPGDDVHVNFTLAEYTPNRLVEIDRVLGDLYGRPTTPGIWPPIDVDNAIMAPDALIRITGIGREELAAILDSGENAAAFFTRSVAGLGKEEPEHQIAALEERLGEKLDANFADFKREYMEMSKAEMFANADEIASVTQAYQYFREEHYFTEDQADYLLQFENPLMVVSDRWSETMQDISPVVQAIFDKDNQDRALRGYVLDDPLAERIARSAEAGEKPSVLAQIRQAREDAKHNPTPRADHTTKDRGSEL